jgi:hypothetical protein
MHKGFKCLDISTGRLYISRDLIFDEKQFSFASLSSNAGVQYTSNTLLLHEPSSGNDTDTDIIDSPACFPLPVSGSCVQQQAQVPGSGSASRRPSSTGPVPDPASPLPGSSDVALVPSHAAVAPVPSPALDGPAMTCTIPALDSTSAVGPVRHPTNYSSSAAAVVRSPATEPSTIATPPVHATATDATTSSPVHCSTVDIGAPSAAPSSSLPSAPSADIIPHRTRLQGGIGKPKKYTDRTIRYGNLAISSTPLNVQEALSVPHWKQAMHDELTALL